MSTDYDHYAPKREDGLSAYVVTTTGWGKSYDSIEWAANLKEAKAQYGYTRQLHHRRSVRRARVSDLTDPARTVHPAGAADTHTTGAGA